MQFYSPGPGRAWRPPMGAQARSEGGGGTGPHAAHLPLRSAALRCRQPAIQGLHLAMHQIAHPAVPESAGRVSGRGRSRSRPFARHVRAVRVLRCHPFSHVRILLAFLRWRHRVPIRGHLQWWSGGGSARLTAQQVTTQQISSIGKGPRDGQRVVERRADHCAIGASQGRERRRRGRRSHANPRPSQPCGRNLEGEGKRKMRG